MAAARLLDHEPQGVHQTRRATASDWVGPALESYNSFVYAQAAALFSPQIFFPTADPTAAIVASLATYGVGYVARPIGAFFVGRCGDTHWRKTVLSVCLFMMGLATMAVGPLPTYPQVGILAPALLVVLRLVQGFALAGEISGASSMILEHAPFGRRGYCGSFTLQGVQAGQIFAAVIFLWSAIVLVAGYYIRREIAETPAFAEDGEKGQVPRSPIVDAFANSWVGMLQVIFMALMNVIAVVAATFGGAYAVQPVRLVSAHYFRLARFPGRWHSRICTPSAARACP